MLTAIISAILSAIAALGGVTLSSHLGGRAQSRGWQHEREQKYREERLIAVSSFVSKAAYIRTACLAGLASNTRPLDLETLSEAHKELQTLATRLRLTAVQFSTVDVAMASADALGSVLQVMRRWSGTESEIAVATLRLASARLQEEVLVSNARHELGLDDLQGMPRYDEEVMLRSFLRKSIHDAEAVERIVGKIQQIKEAGKDSSWLAR
ncbi:hypothetical protein [Actinomadura nitritigenes]|uniref:Secreted protein n=1 Tax=Actinomadura nitritigenes TaxID=134602 RepID=A0ABS3QY86_9ACTN|nr:hypothetical protein [Actinomadura nitritigenes]MBO2438916.1 hypothetical protein [Actinomadura nitritigenes]